MRTWSVMVVLLGLTAVGAASEVELPVNIRIRLQSLQTAGPPFVLSSYVIFSYPGDETTYSLKVVFEGEQSSQSYQMKKNDYNVYLYWTEIGTRKRINYRYIVNGLWSRDHLNPNYLVDQRGVTVSYYIIQAQSLPPYNPVAEKDGYAFYLRADPGQDIYLVGNFNAWHPFTHALEEIEPSLYYILLKLAPGDYFYYYNKKGVFTPDPRNKPYAKDQFGFKFSHFRVE